MSVLDTRQIDYIYLEGDDETPVLVVNDPLSWRPPKDRHHLRALREKLDAQIAFVETGQINSVWPGYGGGKVRVQVHACCALTETAEAFYSAVREAMIRANIDLRVQLLDA
ncbi:MAG TPA: DUF6572 domain-containing protein [Caulobacteraceae bacterium]|jgi:hypothetical protein|nr:DUF6572 domain-containing protein [Caulobacteraceae bacterium]